MNAFEAMTTVIKFANVTMGTGDIDVAQQNYTDAKFLFTKLGNDRGVRAFYSTRCTRFARSASDRMGYHHARPLVGRVLV